MLTSHITPTFLTHELLSILISRNTTETRFFLKKLSKVGTCLGKSVRFLCDLALWDDVLGIDPYFDCPT